MADQKYLPTIGIECHVQLKTKTKLFAAVGNDARQAQPNTLISHICVGMPGALPVLNKEAINLSAKAALALGTEPQRFSRFERKHYFYPDLPKGYQITQYQDPIIKGGQVEIKIDGQSRKIQIERANLEEDAGKNLHPAGADYTLVDLNRAGTPLLEIVSAPDMHSAAEAKAFARELWLLMKYADISDGDLYHGHVRFDVNVSLSADDSQKGTRAEVKNLNSFRSVEAAINYEIKRQAEILEKGERIAQETRGWDEAKQKTFSQRTKEEAEDYRYMPEPDVPPIELGTSLIDGIRRIMPDLPSDYRESFEDAGIDNVTSSILLMQPASAKFVKSIADKFGSEHVKRISNLIVGSFEKLTSGETQLTKITVDPETAVKLSEMRAANRINSNAEKKLWITMNLKGGDPEQIAREEGLLQVSEEAEIERIVAEVITENPKAAEDVKKGEMRAIGFLVGQVMAKSQGQANPSLAQEIIKKQLGL